MVQAYLGKPDYTNAMNQALRTRLAYDQEMNRRRSSGGGGGGGSSRGRTSDSDQTAPFSPQRRAAEREAKRKEDAENLALEQGQADLANTMAAAASTEKQTNLMGEIRPEDLEAKQLSNKMAKSKIEDAGVARMRTVLDNALQYLPQVDQSSYGDWVGWIDEAQVVPRGVLKSEEEVTAMTPVEWKVYNSKLGAMKGYDPKKLKGMIADRDKEDKRLAATKKTKDAARKEYVRIAAAIDKIGAGQNIDPTYLAKLPPAAQAALQKDDHTEAIGVMTEYMQQLKDEYGFDLTPRATPGELSDTQMEQYRKMYEGKYTDEEIRAQYKLYMGSQ